MTCDSKLSRKFCPDVEAFPRLATEIWWWEPRNSSTQVLHNFLVSSVYTDVNSVRNSSTFSWLLASFADSSALNLSSKVWFALNWCVVTSTSLEPYRCSAGIPECSFVRASSYDSVHSPHPEHEVKLHQYTVFLSKRGPPMPYVSLGPFSSSRSGFVCHNQQLTVEAPAVSGWSAGFFRGRLVLRAVLTSTLQQIRRL